MKIIKHGTKFVVKDMTHACEKCGCMFKFNQADCDVKDCYVDEDGKEGDVVSLLFSSKLTHVMKFTIQCPECKQTYKISDDYFIHD